MKQSQVATTLATLAEAAVAVSKEKPFGTVTGNVVIEINHLGEGSVTTALGLGPHRLVGYFSDAEGLGKLLEKLGVCIEKAT